MAVEVFVEHTQQRMTENVLFRIVLQADTLGFMAAVFAARRPASMENAPFQIVLQQGIFRTTVAVFAAGMPASRENVLFWIVIRAELLGMAAVIIHSAWLAAAAFVDIKRD